MANQIQGVADKLIKAATEEFLQKGFQDASLREIAKAAHTSTNSIYVRFGDKAGLFHEVVKPAVEEFRALYTEGKQHYENIKGDVSFDEMSEYNRTWDEKLIEKVYDKFTLYKVLICCSDGTEYKDFAGELAELETQQWLCFVEAIGSDAVCSGRLTVELLHMLTSAYWMGIFEIVRHDMNQEKAKTYVEQIRRFYSCGWKDILEEK